MVLLIAGECGDSSKSFWDFVMNDPSQCRRVISYIAREHHCARAWCNCVNLRTSLSEISTGNEFPCPAKIFIYIFYSCLPSFCSSQIE
jgi:hypothetical protein